MLIDKQFRECVAFLMVDAEDDESGQVVRSARGTAFFVFIPDANRDGVGYAVTARHVIEKSRKHGSLFIRLNRSDGEFQDFATIQDDWILHPKTDVAIIRVEGFPGCRLVYIPVNLIATKEYISKNEIGEGDEAFFVGLFTRQYGKTRNQPVVRFGHISLMPYEEIQIELDPGSEKKLPIFAYLVEANSWGGQSGSPAFVYLPSNRRLGTIEISRSDEKIRLLGLVQGHYEITEDVRFTGDLKNYGSGRVGINAGMAAVIPSEYIIELLMREDVVEQRNTILSQLKQHSASSHSG